MLGKALIVRSWRIRGYYKRPRDRLRWVAVLLVLLFVAFGMLAALLIGYAAISAKSEVRGGKLFPTGIKRDAPALPLGRAALPLSGMSHYLPEAIVAVEDNEFKIFPAVDPVALTRAALADISDGSFRQGGSTITEQLMKQLFIKPRMRGEKLLGRRLDDSVLALEYRLYHTRSQILRNYLSVVYFGEGAYGVGPAARTYFGVPADKLDLAQSATLAGVVQSPGYLDPLQHPESALRRRNLVLEDMLNQKLISRSGYETAAREPLKLASPLHRPPSNSG
jgi:membrane peptidoglycan carboxypeptidase